MCVACDCSMTPTHTTKNGSKRYRYYVCMKAQKRGWKNCKSKSVPAAEIEKFVVDKIRHRWPRRGGWSARWWNNRSEEIRTQTGGHCTGRTGRACQRAGVLERSPPSALPAAGLSQAGRMQHLALEQLAVRHESQFKASMSPRHTSRQRLDRQRRPRRFYREDVNNALTSFEPIWESLTVRSSRGSTS